MDSEPRRPAIKYSECHGRLYQMQQKGQEDIDRIVSVSRWHLWDDHECTTELFQWSGVYNWEGC